MNKKQKFLLSWGVTGLAAICGLVAFFLIFANAASYSFLLKAEEATGLQVALGYQINSIQIFDASAGIILGYLLPLLAGCVIVIGKGKKIISVIAAAMMLTGGILVLCVPSLAVTELKGVEIAGGAVASGVLSLVGALAAGATFFLKN